MTDRATDTRAATNGGRSLLEVHGATKRFGPVLALEDVDLRLQRGEVLALLGDNGAGKSTLVKSITGVHRLDDGEILFDGEDLSARSPAEIRTLGIEAVYQDLALFDNLSAAANLYAGRERCRPRWLGGLGFLRDRQMISEAKRRLDELEVSIPSASMPIGLMSGGQRQAVAVARAVAGSARLVVLDEPTAALGLRESANVLQLIKRLPDSGVSVLLISHNLEHVTAVADRAVVLRRGRQIGEATPSEEEHERIVSMIVGGMGGESGQHEPSDGGGLT